MNLLAPIDVMVQHLITEGKVALVVVPVVILIWLIAIYPPRGRMGPWR